MTDYIEREALVNKLNDLIEELIKENGYYDHYTTGFADCADMVEDEPAVDVAPVVRCGECIYGLPITNSPGEVVCGQHDFTIQPVSGFCHRGEREEGAD